MDTQEKTKRAFRYIILIPHRDAGKLLDAYRTRLFSAGFSGAYSFPAAAPLALVSRPFSREELRELAQKLRECTGETDGKILSAGTALVCSPGGPLSFFGPVLNISAGEWLFPQTAKEKILHTFSPAVLCAALAGSPALSSPGENPVHEEAPSLSFRAASLANLAIRPLDSGEKTYSFEWRIGPPVWLPAFRKV